MLTRDIALTDALLDLLDNCVDGIQRTAPTTKLKTAKSYSGYYAHITFNRDSFKIVDNCGGIPWDKHEYAFRMGRTQKASDADKGLRTVGTYGIGMKRAIFKLGSHCEIHTQHQKNSYSVIITPDWLKTEGDWDMPVKPIGKRMKQDGTEITIRQLNEGIGTNFGEDRERFEGEFISKIAAHYAFIINKGLMVTVNGKPVRPNPTRLAFSTKREQDARGKSILPFIYQATIEGVSVFIAVGFTRPVPPEDDISREMETKKYSSIEAGWTVVCNDRAVLYCDKSELTGWGEAGVPNYHTQFIAISGIVEFSSTDARLLPVTTTKRGIDASSLVYLKVKNKMREGMKIFTDYTYKWKGRAGETKKHMADAEMLTLTDLKKAATGDILRKVGGASTAGHQYKPALPSPDVTTDAPIISFRRPLRKIKAVSGYLFNGDNDVPARRVGEQCFDTIHAEAAK